MNSFSHLCNVYFLSEPSNENKTPEKSKDLVVFEFSENEQNFGKLPKTPRTTKPFKETPPKAFQCSDCKESYSDQFALFEHIANVHDDDDSTNVEEGEYSCNNITTTLIQISRLFYFGFFSKTNHQMMI